MWSDWRPEIVARDFQQLRDQGVQWLRVFPLWPDFQPIHRLRGGGGTPIEMRHGEQPLPDTALGQAGLSAMMMDRFTAFTELAHRADLKLVVGLITGWMSGRLFVPPALDGLDPLTDPVSITWQIKFARGFVTEARHLPAIASWDLGNECNCMSWVRSPEAAFLWTAAVAGAIRSADMSRPIISGMHSLTSSSGDIQNTWFIEDQAELTDILTTHPYPYWSRHTRADPVTALRTTLHATAETRYYADLGSRPCFAEEIGTMGPMVAGDAVSAGFARANLFSLWANDCRGFFWWCGFDQTNLVHAPYDWNGVELELGLLRTDGSPKPVAREMAAFRQFLDGLPFDRLPGRLNDGVCVLTHNQDDWAVAYGSFVLTKQAGLEIRFCQIQQPIPDAPLYLLPSLKGPNCVPRRKWNDLLERVRQGATLYVSLEDGIVPGFNEATGVELLTRSKPRGPISTVLNDAVLPLWDGDDLIFSSRTAEVLASRQDTGTPAFWRHNLGKGQIFVLISPLEKAVTLRPGAFAPDSAPFWQFYATIARALPFTRWLDCPSPDLAVTEHTCDDGSRIVIAINHSEGEKSLSGHLLGGTVLDTIFRGNVISAETHLNLTVPANDAVVFRLKKS